MSTPPPGWYPDPENPAVRRWWDGTAWTAERAPAAAYEPLPTTYAGSPAASVGFGDAVRLGFRKYAAFEGRATRAEFWWWYLFEALAILPFYLFMVIASTTVTTDASGAPTGGFGLMMVAAVLMMIVAFGLLLPTLSVLVRRLHDTGKSGWWYWISLVPFIGGIWLIVLLVGESQPGPNQFGPPSEGAAALAR